MSTGGTGGRPVRGVNYDPSDDPDPKGTAAGYVPEKSQAKSVMGTLKEALRPGDSKMLERQGGDTTHDGRHGGVEETMMRGHRDYDEADEGPLSHRDGVRTDDDDVVAAGGRVLEKAMPGRQEHRNEELKSGSGGEILDALRSGGGKPAAFDREGAVGRQFTSEGAVGGTAQKVGGPFAREGAVGRQFRDDGSVGGSVQDMMGHGDATRKGA
ncbi:hypothetical protein GGR52DRAFT_568689 [Hypoxylon sp. FL1284]|nr:hypothetical protein GGR52DRAFT_568689 [Hypoxylon sp. FL1284]